MKRRANALLLAISIVALCGHSAIAAPIIGFAMGMDTFGNFAIKNTSDSAIISSVTIALPPSTFFDTSASAPGVGLPWSAGIIEGVQSVIFPPSGSDDGQSLTTIGFAGFDPGDAVYFSTDLDRFTDIDGNSGGQALGTQISILFSTGHVLNATVVATPTGFTINGTATAFDHSATASQQLAVEAPEPASLVLWSILGIGGVAAWRRRR